eukprot:764058-Hanusia_phi.AAC.9
MRAWEHGSMRAWEHESMGAWEHGNIFFLPWCLISRCCAPTVDMAFACRDEETFRVSDHKTTSKFHIYSEIIWNGL